MKKVAINELKQIAEGSYILSFTRDFEFLPGQVIEINSGNEQPPRLYSIASGNKDKEVKILFSVKEGGYLTPKLSNCKAGDIIMVSPPFGNFICREQDAFWIASGTGIAPFASMIFSGMWKGKTLIHGSRYLSQFYFQKEISSLMGPAYVRCCSTENAEGVFPGRLTNYLNSLESISPERKYYLCGSAEMVVDTRDILISKGIPYENIIAEIYF